MTDDSIASAKNSVEKKYLEIEIESSRYCVQLGDISEVVPQFEISEVPLAPPYFRGLINLRGKILSVIDLSKKLKNEMIKIEDKKTCVVIFNIDSLEVGALVDRVIAVRSIPDSCIEKHSYVNENKSDFICGIIKEKKDTEDNNNLKFLLDLEKLLDIDEIKKLNNTNSAA